MESPYRTLRCALRHEIAKIKGSRFIATAAPFVDERDLARRIETLRSEFPEANHHAYAWRAGQRFRYGDDGEPSGTAGRPILRQIDGHGLDRVFVVVTRIFGGTKLGAGGLVRAYSAAAREALDHGSIAEVVPTRTVQVTLPYTLTGVLDSVASARGLEATRSDFSSDVTRVFEVATSDVEAFIDEVRERTAGQARIDADGQETREP